jgi:hypothetical protein
VEDTVSIGQILARDEIEQKTAKSNQARHGRSRTTGMAVYGRRQRSRMSSIVGRIRSVVAAEAPSAKEKGEQET